MTNARGARGPARAALTLALIAAPLAASSQPRPAARRDAAEPGDEVTIVAPARREEALLDTPRAVSADTTASARRALARDVGERLDELPGVFVQRTTSASAAPLLRGLGGQRALLLFDGLRLSDSLTKVGGNALLNLIDPSIVQRVEVVRGPASVMYGSDALGGVVQVTPIDAIPRADGSFQWRGEAMLRGASAERSAVTNGFVEGEVGRFGLVLGGALGFTGQLVAGGDLGAQPYTGYGDRALSVRATARLTDRQRVGVALHTSALSDAPRPDLSTPSDVRVFRLQQRDLAYVTWRYATDAFALSARLGAIVRTELRDRFREGRTDTERDQVLTGVASVQFEARHRDARFTAGAEAALDDVESSTDTTRAGRPTETARGRYVGGSTYLSSGLYGLYQQRVGARFLGEVGVRLAVVRATAPIDGAAPAMDQRLVAPVASIGARYLVREGVAVMVNGLTGFRAPNLDDFQALGAGARSFDAPNAALGAERSWTAEVGARVVRDGWTGSLFVFGSALTGLVVRVPSSLDGMTVIDGRRVYTRQNASDATMWGAEFDLTWRARSGLYASVAAMYTQGDATFPDDAGNSVTEPMAKLPPATGRAAVGWRSERAWVDVVLTGGLPQTRLATSDREDVRLCPGGAATCTQVDGWASLTLRGGVAVTPSVVVGAAVENVWNGAFTPYGAGYPASGTNVVGMLRFRAR
ncbi:MAG: TonB-dependent receptor [Polyangiales bacterium]